MDVSREEEDEDEDAGALARVRRARHEVDETLDFLGLGSKRSTRASAMEARFFDIEDPSASSSSAPLGFKARGAVGRPPPREPLSLFL